MVRPGLVIRGIYNIFIAISIKKGPGCGDRGWFGGYVLDPGTGGCRFDSRSLTMLTVTFTFKFASFFLRLFSVFLLDL